jgi:hypothetical protein
VLLLVQHALSQKIFSNTTSEATVLFPTSSIIAASVEGFIMVVGLLLGIALVVRAKIVQRAKQIEEANNNN